MKTVNYQCKKRLYLAFNINVKTFTIIRERLVLRRQLLVKPTYSPRGTGSSGAYVQSITRFSPSEAFFRTWGDAKVKSDDVFVQLKKQKAYDQRNEIGIHTCKYTEHHATPSGEITTSGEIVYR